MPIVAVLFNSCFFSYMGVKKGSSSGQVFTYFSAKTSIAELLIWFGIALLLTLTCLRFYNGMQAQGRDRTKLPYYTKLQPFATWYAVCSISLIMLVSPSHFTDLAWIGLNYSVSCSWVDGQSSSEDTGSPPPLSPTTLLWYCSPSCTSVADSITKRDPRNRVKWTLWRTSQRLKRTRMSRTLITC